MTTLWQQVLHRLEEADVAWCVLRGGAEGVASRNSGDTDLLVCPDDVQQVEDVLGRLGFVRLRAWGYAPHRPFVAYDELSDRWLKLDLVDRIAFGSPAHAITTNLGPACLAGRRWSAGVPVPAAEHELLLLLLHGVLDKQCFAAERQLRMQELCGQVDAARMAELLATYWAPGATWPRIRGAILDGRWPELLNWHQKVARHLTRDQLLRHRWRQLRDRVLRKLYRVARLIQPPAPAVALLAPDGAGKSTLAAELCQSFFFPVRQIYMGSRPPQRPARRWTPGAGFAGLVIRYWSRYLAARFHRGRGRLVVFDRYTYDALLPARRPLNGLRRLRRWMLARACPAPDVIVVLDAPGEVLHERKGEHTVDHLEAQRQAYRDLLKQWPQTVVVDASRSAREVRSEVTAAIWRRYQERELSLGGRT